MSKNIMNNAAATNSEAWAHEFPIKEFTLVDAGKPTSNNKHKHKCDLKASPNASRSSSTASVGPTPKQNICGTTRTSKALCGKKSTGICSKEQGKCAKPSIQQETNRKTGTKLM